MIHRFVWLWQELHRDAKGLYAKARRGDIQEFAGINGLYEPPISPELVVDTL